MGLKRLKISKFLRKLYDLLNDKNYLNDIHWNKDGTSFIIKNFKNFCYNIMPKIFGLNLFSSFHHQLNCYGFIKININEYFNKSFKKDKKDLLLNIKRRKKCKNKSHDNANDEHNISNKKISCILENIQYKLSNIQYRRKILEKQLFLIQKNQECLINKNNFLRNKLIEAQVKQKDLGYIFFSVVENLYPEFALIKKQCLYFINSNNTVSLPNIESKELNNDNNVNINNNSILKEYNINKIDSGISLCNTQDTKTQGEFDYFIDVE